MLLAQGQTERVTCRRPTQGEGNASFLFVSSQSEKLQVYIKTVSTLATGRHGTAAAALHRICM